MKYIKHIIFNHFLWFLFILLLSGCNVDHENNNKIYVVFRFDDYSANSRTELETKIIEAFKDYNLSFTIGVIPYVAADNIFVTTKQELLPLTTYKSEILKKAYDEGVLEIALHGYSHQTINKNEIRSEFSGLEYAKQKDKIEKGKSYLENITGTTIHTFIPPWNSYDFNTLDIIEQFGFRNISADRFGVLEIPSNINFFPSTCDILQIKEAIKSSRNSNNEPTIILALFHEYDFKEVKPKEGVLKIDDLTYILQWVNNQDDLQVLTINDLADKISQDQLESKYLLNNKTIAISRFLPPFFKPSTTHTYASKSFYYSMLLYLILYYFIIFSFSIIITLLLSKVLYRKNNNWLNVLKYTALILLFSVISLIFIKSHIGYNVITLLALLSGSNFGIWIVIYLSKLKIKRPSI